MPEPKTLTNKKLWISLLIALFLLGLKWGAENVRAAQREESNSYPDRLGNIMALPAGAILQETPAVPSNSNCIMCHQYEKLYGITRDSMQFKLTFDKQQFSQSVHGKMGITCISCHTTYTAYPHTGVEQVSCEQCHAENMTVVASLPYDNHRTMEAHLNEACLNCHPDEYTGNNVHSAIAASGGVNPPLCTDCHGGHNVQPPADPPARITTTCSRCHTGIYSDFLAGNHNGADPQTATCADCHIPHDTQAVSNPPTATPEPTPSAEPIYQSYLSQWNSTCTMCHAYPSFTGKAEDSSTLSLTVTDEMLGKSVHGKAGLGCAACHPKITSYPHSDASQLACTACHGSAYPGQEIVANLPYESTRAVSVDLNEACRTCHEEEYQASADSMHMKSFQQGNQDAPLCVDCHGSHEVHSINGTRADISKSCEKCHSAAVSAYRSSVHGVALEKDGVTVAPTCTDCHGAHTVSGPSQADFRNKSVATCANCHQNEQMMSKYGVDTQIFNPNMDNFHGVALSTYEGRSSSQMGDTPVCYDCHGVHTIRKSDDPLSTVNSANLLGTCQKCHTDATSRFASTGLSHNSSTGLALTLQKRVEKIYRVLVYVALVLIVIYILLDVRRRWAEKKELSHPAVTGK